MESQADFKREKGEPLDVLAVRIIKTRAQGRCEYEWYENDVKHRCVELHGEAGIGFKGTVHLALMPTHGLKDNRVAYLKVYCQRHAYKLLEQITNNITAGVSGLKRQRESDQNQTNLF